MRKGTSILLALFTCLIPASSFAQIDIAENRYDKIIVVIGENLGFENLFHSQNDPNMDCVGDSEDAKYIQTLASLALNYTDAHSSTHPSRPNYMRLFAGVDDGQPDGCVCDPSMPCTADPCDGHPCISCGDSQMRGVTDVSTLYSELKAHGTDTSFIYWGEGLYDNGNVNAFICSNADYVQKHNPAAFFANSRNDECTVPVWTGWAQNARPPRADGSGVGTLFPTTPRGVAFVVPGQDHNGHNGADLAAKVLAWNNWLRDNIGVGRRLTDGLSYVDYALHRGVYSNNTDKVLLIVTQDEKSDQDYPCKTCTQCSANHIMLSLIAADLTAQSDSTCVGLDTCPGVAPGQAAQYNILKTITKNFNLANLNNAGTSVSALIPPL